MYNVLMSQCNMFGEVTNYPPKYNCVLMDNYTYDENNWTKIHYKYTNEYWLNIITKQINIMFGYII